MTPTICLFEGFPRSARTGKPSIYCQSGCSSFQYLSRASATMAGRFTPFSRHKISNLSRFRGVRVMFTRTFVLFSSIHNTSFRKNTTKPTPRQAPICHLSRVTPWGGVVVPPQGAEPKTRFSELFGAFCGAETDHALDADTPGPLGTPPQQNSRFVVLAVTQLNKTEPLILLGRLGPRIGAALRLARPSLRPGPVGRAGAPFAGAAPPRPGLRGGSPLGRWVGALRSVRLRARGWRLRRWAIRCRPGSPRTRPGHFAPGTQLPAPSALRGGGHSGPL